MNILTYKGYQGHFEYDEKSGSFCGEVLNINDVVTFCGRSVDELKQALADSVDDYLAFCAEKGRAPEKPYSGRFNVRIPPQVHQKIAMRAAHEGVSINRWVSDTLAHAAG